MALVNIKIEKVIVESDPEIKALLLEIKEMLIKNDQDKVDNLAAKIDESTDKLEKAVTENTVS